MKAVTTALIRQLDQRTIAAGTPGVELMERAGFAVARAAIAFLKRRDSRAALLFAGKGNNGGDTFVAARHLAAAGCEPTLVLLCRPTELQGDTREQFEKMIGTRVVEWGETDLRGDVVVDGLLGTGLTGDVREPHASAIRFMNHLPSPIVAIDIPSGLDSDTGEIRGVCVRADVTVTMGLPKIGLLRPGAADYVGRIEIADIGFPREFVDEIQTDVELLTADDVRPLFPPRHRAAHKGDFGHLLIIAGSEGYTGAPVLTAHAAARAGAGLVTLAVPRNIYPIVAATCPPEIMPRPLDQFDSFENFSAIAIGPGMGRSAEAQSFVINLLANVTKPTVVDADAINALAATGAPLRPGLVLTPHPGEMARLVGKSAKEVQTQRWEIARGFAQARGVVLVLKGAGSVVTDHTGKLWINSTGNPGMAKGGMGDALTGIIGALLAQGIAPLDAARAGVFIHGLAGDLAAERAGEIAMQAGDLIANLGAAFESVG